MQPLQRSKSGVRPYLGFEGPRKEGKLQNQPETNPIIASNTHTAAEGPSLYAKHPHTAQQNAPRHARHWALPAPASLPALCLLQRSQVRTSTPPHLPLPHRQCDPASHAPGPLPDTNAPGLLLATNNQFARCPCLPPPPTHTLCPSTGLATQSCCPRSWQWTPTSSHRWVTQEQQTTDSRPDDGSRSMLSAQTAASRLLT